MTTLLKTVNLCKSYGALRVTDGVSLDIQTGELHAIIGPNGAGKTTLINQLSGELASDSGEVHFAGKDVTRSNIQSRARHGLLRSYQITSVFDEFTVLENATLSALGAQQQAFGAWQALLQQPAALQSANEAMALAGLQHLADIKVCELAYGERRQLELVMALAAKPRFLLLDEPMAGMSVQESAAVVALLQSLKGKYTILLVEHDMNAVFALADRISVLVYGQLLVTGTPDEIRHNAEVRSVYLGDEEIDA
jgi:branched-chain amino acid transport system ATP-binding protein